VTTKKKITKKKTARSTIPITEAEKQRRALWARARKASTSKKPAKKVTSRKRASNAVEPTMPRICYYVPADADRDERGRYRVSIVVEGKPGHRPTGIWPQDGAQEMPYFWGPTLEAALDTAMRVNKTNLGLTERDVHTIVASSMRVPSPRAPRTRARRAS
jgi:hypothetical protein